MKTASGCIASLAYFAFVGMMLIGNMIGDCIPGMGHSCPTDHERNVHLLEILLGSVAIYIALAFAIIRFTNRKASDD